MTVRSMKFAGSLPPDVSVHSIAQYENLIIIAASDGIWIIDRDGFPPTLTKLEPQTFKDGRLN